MKQNRLLILILLFSLYSCNETKQKQRPELSSLVDTLTTIIPENNDCKYSVKTIGKNSSDTSEVKLIGLYENLTNSGESTYGYSLMIWQFGNEVIGFLNFYEGGPEPTRNGPIVQGTLINNSLKLKVWTQQNKSYEDWNKSDVIIYHFKMEKSKNKLVGFLSTFNCTDKETMLLKDEKVELISSEIWELNDFKNINEWKNEYSYSLDY